MSLGKALAVGFLELVIMGLLVLALVLVSDKAFPDHYAVLEPVGFCQQSHCVRVKAASPAKDHYVGEFFYANPRSLPSPVIKQQQQVIQRAIAGKHRIKCQLRHKPLGKRLIRRCIVLEIDSKPVK